MSKSDWNNNIYYIAQSEDLFIKWERIMFLFYKKCKAFISNQGKEGMFFL